MVLLLMKHKVRIESLDIMSIERPNEIFPLERYPGYYLTIVEESFWTHAAIDPEDCVYVPQGFSILTNGRSGTKEEKLLNPNAGGHVKLYGKAKIIQMKPEQIGELVAPKETLKLKRFLADRTPHEIVAAETEAEAERAAAKHKILVRREQKKLDLRAEAEKIERSRWTGSMKELDEVFAARRTVERAERIRIKDNLAQLDRIALRKLL